MPDITGKPYCSILSYVVLALMQYLLSLGYCTCNRVDKWSTLGQSEWPRVQSIMKVKPISKGSLESFLGINKGTDTLFLKYSS